MSEESEIQDRELSALGLTKNMRKNLVVSIMILQFGAISFLFKQNITLNNKIDGIRSAQIDSSNAMYNRLVQQVAIKMNPVKEEIQNIRENIAETDSLQRKIIQENKLSTK